MNADIQLAIANLFGHCMEITEAGRYHAFMEYSAHVNAIYVRVLPADTDYQSGVRNEQLDEVVYLSGICGGTPKDVLTNLHALTDRVCEFLLDHKEEAA